MDKIEITYDVGKCIGAKKCVFAAPNLFSFADEKAVLKHATVSGHQSTYCGEMDKREMDNAVKAAEDCPVNAIMVKNLSKEDTIVTTEIQVNNQQTFTAEYDDLKEFVIDPLGYFLIRIDAQKEIIEVGLCRELNKVSVTITGNKPLEIYQTIIKNKLVSRLDHAAYLGRELQKAYIALKKKIPYMQDDELEL